MERFLNSTRYIETHLFTKITLDEIAHSAHFSTYHYCRMFRVLVGETVMGYIRKRRLSIAALRLLSEDISVIDLAMHCQFESHEAFTRAFKKMFQVTPTAFKTAQYPVGPNYRKPVTQRTLEHLQSNVSITPDFVSHDAFKVAGIRSVYNQENKINIPQLWQRFLTENAYFSTYPDVQAHYGVVNSINYGEFEYIAGRPITNQDAIPDGMVKVDIPARTYARFTHRGAIQNVGETVSYIWATWLPNSQYEATGTPEFEHYATDFDPVNPECTFDFYIPIMEKTL